MGRSPRSPLTNMERVRLTMIANLVQLYPNDYDDNPDVRQWIKRLCQGLPPLARRVARRLLGRMKIKTDRTVMSDADYLALDIMAYVRMIATENASVHWGQRR